MVGEDLAFGSIPKIAGGSLRERLESARKDPQTAQSFSKMHPLADTLPAKADLKGSISEYNKNIKALKAVFEGKKKQLTEDERNSFKLLNYVSGTIRRLGAPINADGSEDLLGLYDDCVRNAASFFSTDYFNRSFKLNRDVFVGILYPQMILCSGICDEDSPKEMRSIRGILAASFASDASEGNQYKPGEGISGMAEKETKKAAGPFDAIKTKPGGGWFAVMHVHDMFGRPVSEEDRKALLQAKKLVLASDLPSEKKKALFDYIKLAESKNGGMFSFSQAITVVNAYFEGEVSEEQLNFEVSLMDAWCNGRIEDFLKSERAALSTLKIPEDEKQKSIYLLDLALTKDKIFQASAAQGLRIYHPLAEPEERQKVLKAGIYIIESAQSVK